MFQFREDRIYRHLEPALAFQLEINRMRNFDLEAIPTANSKMHLYLGKAKVRRWHIQFCFPVPTGIMFAMVYKSHFSEFCKLLSFRSEKTSNAIYKKAMMIKCSCMMHIIDVITYPLCFPLLYAASWNPIFNIFIVFGFQQVAKGQEVTDYRFFVRSIIRHSDLVTKVINKELNFQNVLRLKIWNSAISFWSCYGIECPSLFAATRAEAHWNHPFGRPLHLTV